MDLPEELEKALKPMFADLPPDVAMFRLVIDQPPSAAVVGMVETILREPALAGREVLHAGVWLYVDDLDRSHSICQGIDDETGSFWHGIMHRREGDFSNSHYWFKKVGQHPAMSRVGGYEPHEFITAVETLHTDDPQELIALQRREWETLFSYCVSEYPS
jgi:hypothetical protein